MKRAELIQSLRAEAAAAGKTFELARQGRAHEIWQVRLAKVSIPRHREISPGVTRSIMKTVRDELER